MFSALREVQIPLLAVMLLGGCAAKAWRALHSRSAAAGMDATGLVPLHLRRPAVVTLFTAEALLGLGLIGTAGRLGDTTPRLPATAGPVPHRRAPRRDRRHARPPPSTSPWTR